MINTKIIEASIYRSGCFIKRSGNIELKKGKQNIEIDGLTSSLNPETLKIALPKNVSGSNIRIENLSEEKQEEINRELIDRLNETKRKLEVRNKQLELINNSADFSAKENISINEMSDYIDLLPDKMEKIYEQIDELEKEKKVLEKKLNEARNKTRAYYVRLDIEADEDISIPFELSYFETCASWYPIYEIHTAENDTVSIKLKGKIRQNTIEDWKDIKINLFTGNPEISADIPILYPEKLNFYEPRIFKAGGMNNALYAGMAMEKATMSLDEEALEEPLYDVDQVAAERIENDTMMEYDLNGLYDLDHINELTVNLSEHNIACHYHVIAVPKLDNYGYLAAEVDSKEISELYNTSATIYHLGTYLGNAYIDVDTSKEKYDISLGRDESIKLKREQKKKYASNVLLKGQKKMEYEYLIEVNSNKSSAVDITLYDQIPISQDKSINVDINEISGGKLEEDSGKLIYDFHLEPKEKKEIKLAYSISWPKDKNINI